MGRDYPDWGGMPVSGTTYPLKDLAEHAVRLGSPVNFDRSGAVAWIGNFEFGLGDFSYTHVGAGASDPSLDNAYYSSGGVSCRMQPGVSLGQYASIGHYMPRMPLGLWGMSFRWSCSTVKGRIQVFLDNLGLDKDDQYGVQIDLSNLKVQSYAGGVTWDDLFICPTPLPNSSCFNFFKLVVDVTNRRLVRVRVNDTTLAGLTVAPYNPPIPSYEYVIASILTISDGAGQGEFHLDDIILTYNESE